MAGNDFEQGYSFSLKRMLLLEKTFFLHAPLAKGEEYSFDVSIQIDGKPEIQESTHIMSVKVVKKGEKNPVGTIVLGCNFSIPNYQEYLLSSDDKVSLPDELIQLLNVVVVGAMRGVMFSEFRGTSLGAAYLPVLDARRLSKNSE
jgi:hypothetical protein